MLSLECVHMRFDMHLLLCILHEGMYLSNVSMCFFCRPQHLIQYPRTDGDRHLQQLRLPRTAAPCATGKVQHPARSYLTPMYLQHQRVDQYQQRVYCAGGPAGRLGGLSALPRPSGSQRITHTPAPLSAGRYLAVSTATWQRCTHATMVLMLEVHDVTVAMSICSSHQAS